MQGNTENRLAATSVPARPRGRNPCLALRIGIAISAGTGPSHVEENVVIHRGVRRYFAVATYEPWSGQEVDRIPCYVDCLMHWSGDDETLPGYP